MDTRQASVLFYDSSRERYVDYKEFQEENKILIEENLDLDINNGYNLVSFHYKIQEDIEFNGEVFEGKQYGAFLRVDVPIDHGFDYDFYHKIIILQDISEELGCDVESIIPIDKEEFDEDSI